MEIKCGFGIFVQLQTIQIHTNMKKLLILCAILLASGFLYAQEKPSRVAFSNLGISLNGSTTGVGFTLSTPLAKHFVLRAGYQFSYLSYGYQYEDFESINVAGRDVNVPDLDLDAKLNVDAAHVMVDWVPFKKGKGTFFITAGCFIGGSDLITIDGQFDMSDPNIKEIQQAGLLKDIEIEVGDDIVCVNEDGSMSAALQVKGVRPYVGLGWGRAIPKHRFGFRFELGAVFHGRPEVVSDNLISSGTGGEISDFNKIINDITVFPQLSFQLTYRLFKNK